MGNSPGTGPYLGMLGLYYSFNQIIDAIDLIESTHERLDIYSPRR